MGNFKKRKRISPSGVVSNADVDADRRVDRRGDTSVSPNEPQQKLQPPHTDTSTWSYGAESQSREGQQYRRRQLSGRHRPPSEGGKIPKLLRLPADVVYILDRLKGLMGQPYNDIASEAIRDLWHKRYTGIYKDALQQRDARR